MERTVGLVHGLPVHCVTLAYQEVPTSCDALQGVLASSD